MIAGGAAARDGQMQAGDRIVAVDPGTGDYELLYGQPELNRVVDLIRGEAGSVVKLRIVRPDESGALMDRTIELQREQIVMPGTEKSNETVSES